MPFTPGPWSVGRTLATPTTRKWTPEEITANDKIEHLMVFSHFIPDDQGKSRQLVATCVVPDDARLIALAPEMFKKLKQLAELGCGLCSCELRDEALKLIEQVEGEG